MTEYLFWKDPYLKEFKAKILEIDGNNIILDQTCFYAESGGQPGDVGVLNEQRILNTVFSTDKKTVLHKSAGDMHLNPGQEVLGKINWDRRYRFMRLHSALHLTYAVFVEKYGDKRVIGSSISDTKARVDFSFHNSIDLTGLQDKVINVISKGIPIEIKTDIDNPYKRTWVVKGLTPVPCGGTHPKNTSEIGMVSLRLKKLGRQGQRIYASLTG